MPPFEDSRPLLIANVGEEGEGQSERDALSVPGCEREPVPVVPGAGWPNTDHITCQALASRRFDVTITGPGGHSWSDYGVGQSGARAQPRGHAFTDKRPRAGANGNGPRSSFNFGVIEGGSSINSIPSEARAKVDLRSESAERIDRMAALLSSPVERAVEVENGRRNGAAGDCAGERDRLAAGRRAARGCAYGRMHASRRSHPGHAQPSGLFLDRRQYSVVAGDSGGFDRRGGAGRRRAHGGGMVFAGWPGNRAAADFIGAVLANVRSKRTRSGIIGKPEGSCRHHPHEAL